MEMQRDLKLQSISCKNYKYSSLFCNLPNLSSSVQRLGCESKIKDRYSKDWKTVYYFFNLKNVMIYYNLQRVKASFFQRVKASLLSWWSIASELLRSWVLILL